MISMIKATLAAASVLFIFFYGMSFALEHPKVSKELMDIIHNKTPKTAR